MATQKAGPAHLALVEHDLGWWAAWIAAPWRGAVEQILETGRRLRVAKAALAHGEWLTLFRDRKLRPFGPETAARLMKIAAHPVLGDVAHAPHLPPSWMTLYELTKLPEDRLRACLASGEVHADMERKDATRLLDRERQVKRLRANFSVRLAHPTHIHALGGDCGLCAQEKAVRKLGAELRAKGMVASTTNEDGFVEFVRRELHSFERLMRMLMGPAAWAALRGRAAAAGLTVPELVARDETEKQV